MNVRNYIKDKINANEAFILDHGKTVNEGELKYKDDVTSYSWIFIETISLRKVCQF